MWELVRDCGRIIEDCADHRYIIGFIKICSKSLGFFENQIHIVERQGFIKTAAA